MAAAKQAVLAQQRAMQAQHAAQQAAGGGGGGGSGAAAAGSATGAARAPPEVPLTQTAVLDRVLSHAAFSQLGLPVEQLKVFLNRIVDAETLGQISSVYSRVTLGELSSEEAESVVAGIIQVREGRAGGGR